MDSADDLPCGRGFPIRTSADQRSLASPRGFSQRATSFIASRRQGIHRTPLSRSGQANARKHRNKRRRPRAGPSLAGRATNGGGRHPPRTTTRPRRTHTQYTQSLFTCERTPAAAPAPRGRRNNGHGFGGGAAAATPAGRSAKRAELEAIGFEPTTPCLQSRCSPG